MPPREGVPHILETTDLTKCTYTDALYASRLLEHAHKHASHLIVSRSGYRSVRPSVRPSVQVVSTAERLLLVFMT